jgi:hypothetical protein
MIFEIPLSAISESFDIELGGVTYTLTTRWNTAGFWALDIADGQGVMLVECLPLVTGLDLLAQFPGFGDGGLMVMSDGDPYTLPTLETLGTDSHLFYDDGAS